MKKHLTKIANVVLISGALFTLSGCYELLVPVVKQAFAPTIDAQVLKYEAKRDKLKKQYEGRVAGIKKSIETSKKDIAEALQKRDVKNAVSSLRRLRIYTRPCHTPKGVKETCDGGKFKNERIIVRENIGREDEIITEFVEKLYTITQALIKERQFNTLDVGLADAALIPASEKRVKDFVSIHKRTKELWIEALLSDAKAAKAGSPAAAMLYYAKAAKLAKAIKKDDQAQNYLSQASAIRSRMLKQYTFEVHVKGTTGSGHDKVRKNITSGSSSIGKQRFVYSSSGETDLTFSLSLNAHSSSRSTGKTSGSFKYKSGTKQVPNPKVKDVESEIKSLQGRKKDKERDAESYDRQAASHAKCNGGQSAEWCQNQAADKRRIAAGRRKEAQEYASEISEAQTKLAAMPKTITQDVFSNYSYPIKLNHLDVRQAGSLNFAYPNGRSKNFSLSEKHRLTDQSHSAYSKNGSGVSADSEVLPKVPSALPSIYSKLAKSVTSEINSEFTRYRNQFTATPSGAKGIHNLSLFILLDPNNISKEIAEKLVKMTDMDDAVKLITDLK